MTNKSVVSGRTPEEMKLHRFTKREIFPEIILSIFKNQSVY